MNKKTVRNFLLIALIALCGISITACKNDDNTEKEKYVNLDLNYMKYLSADISDATALGIKKNSSQPSAKKAKTNNEASSEEERMYLYKTTEDLSNGSVEYDENGLTKVTFKKSTSVTEEVYDSEGHII